MKYRLAILLLLAAIGTESRAAKSTFNVVEATIPEMQAALKSGQVTSHDLVQQYLTRIATYEDKLNAAITVNPDALKEADERDLDAMPSISTTTKSRSCTGATSWVARIRNTRGRRSSQSSRSTTNSHSSRERSRFAAFLSGPADAPAG